MDSSITTLKTGLFTIVGYLRLVFTITICFIEIPVVNANSADPDHSAVSNLGLHSLPITIMRVSKLK